MQPPGFPLSYEHVPCLDIVCDLGSFRGLYELPSLGMDAFSVLDIKPPPVWTPSSRIDHLSPISEVPRCRGQVQKQQCQRHGRYTRRPVVPGVPARLRTALTTVFFHLNLFSQIHYSSFANPFLLRPFRNS